MNKLVIVESPSKAKTITKYLGKGYTVKASVGHIRDLPKKLGVDTENDFQEEYEIPSSKTKVVASLRSAAKDATEIILATDPDREGEAISWHLLEAINPPKNIPVSRVLFNEITPTGIAKAMAAPTTINKKLVDAQRARRVLDRLVGYKVSQVLWGKVRRGLSAGRVQSVAVRLIVDREREILKFNPIEYWVISGLFLTELQPNFQMKLTKLSGALLQLGNKEAKRVIKNESEANALRDMIAQTTWKVTNLKTKEKKRNPPAPFTTAKLQQESAQKLHMNVARTMQNAQRLYEGVDFGEGPVGLITYMRTDSSRIAPEVIENIRTYIVDRYGREYLPNKPRVYKSKGTAQNAHEAIRPTDISLTPEILRNRLESDQLRLYTLIWRRTVASQMESAQLDETIVESTATLLNNEEATFQAKDDIERFPGWLKMYHIDNKEDKEEEALANTIIKEDDSEASTGLPPLKLGQQLVLKQIDANQQFTKPSARFSEATLVKELEEDGIGRPSTYASIIATIQDRDYVKKSEGHFKPTELGCVVTDLLVQGFQNLMEPSYTSNLESELDRIEDGEITFLKAMKDFYGPFEKLLVSANIDMANLKAGVITDKKCKKCESPMLKRIGKNGLFFGCSRYPDCNSTEEVENIEEPGDAPECPLCGASLMTLRKGQFGPFWACSNYPSCKGIRKADPKGIPVPADIDLDEMCPTCGKNYVKRYGRYGEFICCIDYPTCKTVKKEILAVSCPKCGGDISPRTSRFGVFYGCTKYPKCDFSAWDKPVPRSCPVCKGNYMVEKKRKPRGKEPITLMLCPTCKHEEPLE